MPTKTVLKLLRIAMGYGSRTAKIQMMLDSPDPAISITARSLMAAGYINRTDGTITLEPR